jgi:hypothetical protein
MMARNEQPGLGPFMGAETAIETLPVRPSPELEQELGQEVSHSFEPSSGGSIPPLGGFFPPSDQVTESVYNGPVIMVEGDVMVQALKSFDYDVPEPSAPELQLVAPMLEIPSPSAPTLRGWAQFARSSDPTLFASLCEMIFGPYSPVVIRETKEATSQLRFILDFDTFGGLLDFIDNSASTWKRNLCFRSEQEMITDLRKLFAFLALVKERRDIYHKILHFCWVVSTSGIVDKKTSTLIFRILLKNLVEQFSIFLRDGPAKPLAEQPFLVRAKVSVKKMIFTPKSTRSELLIGAAQTDFHLWSAMFDACEEIESKMDW